MKNDERTERVPIWLDPKKRGLAYQVVILCAVGLLGFYIISNTQRNLQKQSIATGVGFLTKEASFEIGESVIPYSAANSYARALLVGLLNTLKVAFIGIVLTVILGAFIGIARLSPNFLVAKLAAIYIEVMQNIPILLQLFLWHAMFYENLPSPGQSLNPISGVFLNNRGLYLAVPESHPVHRYMIAAFLAGCVLVVLLYRWAGKRHDETGKTFPVFYSSVGLLIGLPLIAWLLGGAPTEMNVPALMAFNYEGGFTVSPEFTALLLGLVLYTAAFVAEIVRAGIQSVSKGQTEAAMSIGLKPGRVMSLVVLPQAMRVIIPPLTSQMLNLTKNSSLAIAIGYPDFVSVANTTINQTGQATEGVALIMLCYLTFSLLTSTFMNWYKKKTALVER